jgi:hypothetical protein
VSQYNKGARADFIQQGGGEHSVRHRRAIGDGQAQYRSGLFEREANRGVYSQDLSDVNNWTAQQKMGVVHGGMLEDNAAIAIKQGIMYGANAAMMLGGGGLVLQGTRLLAKTVMSGSSSMLGVAGYTVLGGSTVAYGADIMATAGRGMRNDTMEATYTNRWLTEVTGSALAAGVIEMGLGLGLGVGSVLAGARMQTASPGVRFSGNNGSFFGESDFALGKLNGDAFEVIKHTIKGNRPNPQVYISKNSYDLHMSKFDDGASYFVSKEILDDFGYDLLGMPDNSQFVLSKIEMDDLIASSGGDMSVIEGALGIPIGNWKHQPMVRIDVMNPAELNIRMPSGNEMGANSLWLPGGKLPTGYSESVIDMIPNNKYILREKWYE